MNVIGPYLKAVTDVWNGLTHDDKFTKDTALRGDWHKKFLRRERERVNDWYKINFQGFYEQPEYSRFLRDNFIRLFVLAGVERLITIRQSTEILRQRYLYAPTNLGAINALRSDGRLLGSFRGNFFHLLHTSAVQYLAVRHAEGDFLRYFILSLGLEAVTYPLETIKTLLHANVGRQFRGAYDALTQTFLREPSIGRLWRGLEFKLGHCTFYGLHLWAVSNDSWTSVLTLPLLLLSYPLLVLKTHSQIANTPLAGETSNLEFILQRITSGRGIRSLYAGAIPYTLLNTVFLWYLPSIFSEKKKTRVLDEIADQYEVPKQTGRYL
eukprot:TRINITY_DN66_c0_g1_i1.p1 TRINITY_DN66_c0_g1~~TRINITY_DN66_c0_g1_i1.p1  ORF type:complete len:324 (+),score=72.14 TRINITY_DN66_c0_g1_i1:100-1071(+)